MNMCKNKRFGLWRALAVVAGLVLVAAACGGDEDDGDGSVSAEDNAGAASSDTDESPSTTTLPTQPIPDQDMPEVEMPADDDPSAEMPDDDMPGEDVPAPASDDPDGDMAPDDDPVDEPVELTATWRGVTADTITVGVSLIDLQLLQDMGMTQAGWGDQEGVFEAILDDLNANGGIHGRKLVAVYDYYSPVSGDDATRACTALTQDHEVFAVLVGFLGPLAGTADPCIVGTNETILVGGEQTPGELEQAKAPWFSFFPSTEVGTEVLLDLLIETGRAEDKRIFVVSHQSAQGDEPNVLEALNERSLEVVGTAILDANDTDTVLQYAIMENISERIRADGANVVLINGNASTIISGLGQSGLIDSVEVWANSTISLNNLGDTIDRQLARGAVTSDGPTDEERWNDPMLQDCVGIVREAIPEADVRNPAELEPDDESWFTSVWAHCGHIRLFEQIARNAGPDLTPDTFEAAAHSMNDFALPGVYANSLSPTKFGAQDLFRLSEYDPDKGDGQTVPLTDLIDIYP